MARESPLTPRTRQCRSGKATLKAMKSKHSAIRQLLKIKLGFFLHPRLCRHGNHKLIAKFLRNTTHSEDHVTSLADASGAIKPLAVHLIKRLENRTTISVTMRKLIARKTIAV